MVKLTRAIGLIAALLILPSVAPAQGLRHAYLGHYQYTATSGKITLQLPTSATGKTARMIELFVSCPEADCTVEYTLAGGLATTTSATRYRLRSRSAATSSALFYTASNATGGTALPAIPLPAGFTGSLNSADFELLPGQAITIAVASASQTVTLIPKWEEY